MAIEHEIFTIPAHYNGKDESNAALDKLEAEGWTPLSIAADPRTPQLFVLCARAAS